MKTFIRYTLMLFRIVMAFAASLFAVRPVAFTRRDPAAAGDQVPAHFVNKYADDVTLNMQQTTSRLEPYATVHSGVVGASESCDNVGSSESQEVTTRFSDMEANNTPHTRRWIDLRDFDWFDYVDSFDKLKVLTDPTNKYVTLAVAAHNRRKDRLIVEAALGSVREQTGQGNNGSSQYVVLPAGQKILHGGTNISMAKIRSAIELMNAAEAASPEEGGERIFVYTSSQLTVLMADNTLTSSDYNTLQALMDYKVESFMGMTWKRTEILPKVGTTRSCCIFGKGYMHLGIGQEITNDVAVNKNKRGYPYQVYSMMSLGAARSEDKGVVEIQCTEP
ncbi:hypothetical protein F6V25_07965 [Oryzomonas japonica]|uniref:Uncharacterized protein n=1 Tax=Oryzomonas japonica TaxID=2603858 RepID=A0A7J4ZR60_9BACT|nr:phage capsid protein [Oryzomonas japonica]KAB0665648.1 hypothetical protein F6V25_07965 [Oryzomonas japonica]